MHLHICSMATTFRLLMAKFHVASLVMTTIPHGELQALIIGYQLTSTVVEAMMVSIDLCHPSVWTQGPTFLYLPTHLWPTHTQQVQDRVIQVPTEQLH